MSHATIHRSFPGRTADEIYEKVDQAMEDIAQQFSLHYHRDGDKRAGKVSKMGVHGVYSVHNEAVTVELKFPMMVPHSMRQKVQVKIEQHLDRLFG